MQTIQSFSRFILLTWYQSHSSDFLVPVDISGVLPLPSPSSSSHYQKRVTVVTPTVPSLSDIIVLPIQLPKQRQSDRTANPEQNPTKNSQKPHHTRRLKFLSHEHVLHVLSVSLTRFTRKRHAPHTLPCATCACYSSRTATSALG